MRNKYLLYIGIFLCMGIWACSNDAVYYDVNQKRSIYFTWDRYNSVTKTASDTVFSVSPCTTRPSTSIEFRSRWPECRLARN